MNTHYVHLRHPRCSVLLECTPEGRVLWRHWGAPLRALPISTPEQSVIEHTCHQLDALVGGAFNRRVVPPSSLDQPLGSTVLPGFGLGESGAAAALAHRAGRDFTLDLRLKKVDSWWCSKQASGEPPGVVLRLSDEVARIEAAVFMRLTASGALCMHTEITNADPEPLTLQWLAAATLVFPERAAEVLSLYGHWAHEFQVQRLPLQRAVWRRESIRGRTGHDGFPGFYLLASGCTRDDGEAWAAQLAWSGNYALQVEPLDDGRWQAQLGEWLAPGEVSLAQGESIQTPDVVSVYSRCGLNGAMQTFHAEVRARLAWPAESMRPRPIHLNTWEALYFDHQAPALDALVDAAASIGVERFVLDDGWFVGRYSDRAALGDWIPDPDKYPQGLAPLIERVRQRGMEFGLWVEPEMINPDSALFRQHPDWALQIAGRPMQTWRNQLVLDLSRAEVREYLFECLNAVLRSGPIAYLKWDMNRDLTQAGRSDGSPAYRSNVLALRNLMEKIRKAHPSLEIETCASGGGRADLGMLAHAVRIWTSDSNDAVSRVSIQRGLMLFMPPEIMGAHVGPSPVHTTGRTQSMPFAAGVALPFHMGLELDVRQLNETDRQVLAQWLDLHKQLRGTLHGGRVWLGESSQGLTWQLHQAPDSDALHWVLVVQRLEPMDRRFDSPIRLPIPHEGLVRLRRIDPTPQEPLQGPNCVQLRQAEGVMIHTEVLREMGFSLPRLLAHSVAVFSIEVVH